MKEKSITFEQTYFQKLYVSEIDIIRRYMRSENLFLSLYKDLVDEWSLFYNGDDKFELIANNQMLIDEITYNNFLKDVQYERI